MNQLHWRYRGKVNPLKLPPASPRVAGWVNDMCRAAGGGRLKMADQAGWHALLEEPPAFQVDVAVHAAQRNWGLGGMEGAINWDGRIHIGLFTHLLRRNLPFSNENLAYFVTIAAHEELGSYGFPFDLVLKAVERFCAGRPPDGPLRKALVALKGRAEGDWQATRYGERMSRRILLIFDPKLSELGLVLSKDDDWAPELRRWLETLDGPRRAQWEAILAHCAATTGRPRPSRRWLARAGTLVAEVGPAEVTGHLIGWLEEVHPFTVSYYCTDDVLKGMIWFSAGLDRAAIAGPLGRFADVCFEKIPGIGPGSLKLGNACLFALGGMADTDEAVAALAQLKTRVRYHRVRARIEQLLAAIAEAKGVSATDLEESALPRFELDEDGLSFIAFGEATAIVAVTATGVTLSWLGRDDKQRKGVPVSVKRDYADALGAVRQQVKELADTRKAQLQRLEATWIEGRDWPVDVWRERYLGHPLRLACTRALIWSFETARGPVPAIPAGDSFVTIAGDDFEPSPGARVRLWHPIESSALEVMAWRRLMVEATITQPIRQAHREVYVLTNAERATGVYSNRFAAHVLRQHQLRALCHARGWTYDFQAGWDGWSVPARVVSQQDLVVRYHVEQIENGDLSAMEIPLHVTTDRVQFSRGNGEPIALADLTPVVFSEAMRDVDLFVAVTSVANDPDWVDGGPGGRHGDYWRATAFGELGETARTRREMMAAIAPSLAIADRLRVTDRYLVVRGNRNSYRIHLGSGNIQILPDNRNLCIVRSAKGLKQDHSVQLPFAGDSRLSMILSKAFLLAADDAITDPTILSQLGR